MGGHLARKIASELDAFLLPVMPFGNSQEHQDFFGTIWIQPATLAQVVKDVCRSLKHHGIRKVLVVDAHGGNWILKPTVREINLNDPEMMVIMMGPGTITGALRGAKIELHCTNTETARMMYAFPELVKGKVADFHPDVGREFLDYVGMRAVAPTGVWGTPSTATPEMGKENIDDMVRQIVDYARDTFARLDEIKGQSG
jgi:creatinine amidohydrolase